MEKQIQVNHRALGFVVALRAHRAQLYHIHQRQEMATTVRERLGRPRLKKSNTLSYHTHEESFAQVSREQYPFLALASTILEKKTRVHSPHYCEKPMVFQKN